MIFHLLIVDDETPIRKGLTQVINWEAIDCIIDDTASDGLEAIEKMKKYNIDIIITDIRMPEADGLVLAKYVMENYPDIKVIILSGYADFKYAQTAIQYNVSDFLLKPISIEQVVNAVQNAQKEIIANRQKNSFQKSDIAFMKDQLLQELTDTAVTESLKSRLDSYGILLDSYYIAAFQLIPSNENIPSLKEIMIKQKSDNYCYRYNSLIISVYFCREEKGEIPESILQNCREITSIITSLYGQEISIGISRHHNSPDEYSVAVFESIHALTLNFYSPDSIAAYGEHPSPADDTLSAEETLALYELETAMINLDFDNVTLIANSIFNKLKSSFAKSTDAKNICTQIYYIGCRILLKKGVPTPDSSVIKQIKHSNDIFELEKIVRSFLVFLSRTLPGSRNDYNRIVTNSIRYINQNIASPLTLEILAGHVHANPSYLSRTFKKETGHSITEYINMQRVDRAKELLLDKSILTYEIAEKVGFNDPAYFSSIFKKYTGKSPKEYKG